ncbi:hypothetical protein D3C75_1170760 [compost metagenome]
MLRQSVILFISLQGWYDDSMFVERDRKETFVYAGGSVFTGRKKGQCSCRPDAAGGGQTGQGSGQNAVQRRLELPDVQG